MPNDGRAIDISKVKEAAPIERVLAHYGITLKKSGRQLAGCCPIHKGSNKRAFVVDPHKGVWRCFADCDRGGTVIDLVVEIENVSAREAAFMIADWLGIDAGKAQERRQAMSGNMPSHKVFAVDGEGDEAFWTRVGSAWQNKDGKGYNIVLQALPVNGRLVLREPNDEEAEVKSSKTSRKK